MFLDESVRKHRRQKRRERMISDKQKRTNKKKLEVEPEVITPIHTTTVGEMYDWILFFPGTLDDLIEFWRKWEPGDRLPGISKREDTLCKRKVNIIANPYILSNVDYDENSCCVVWHKEETSEFYYFGRKTPRIVKQQKRFGDPIVVIQP